MFGGRTVPGAVRGRFWRVHRAGVDVYIVSEAVRV